MKKLIISLILVAVGNFSFAQDTAYISRERTTALFFNACVKVVNEPVGVKVNHKENALITLKAFKSGAYQILKVQECGTNKIYRIPVTYSYGRAGRSILIGQNVLFKSNPVTKTYGYKIVANELASGKRQDVADHGKIGDIKAWVNKISLADDKLFLRLDIRNKSKLPYEVDFVRFYIRDLNTVQRMATHEREILPVYSTLHKRISINHKQEIAKVFAFNRFSLSEDQALDVELYERHGNRHIYLQVKQNDLDNLKIFQSKPQRPSNNMVVNSL